MTIRDLAPWLFEQQHFQDAYGRLVREAVSAEFAHVLQPAQLALDPAPEWDFLLFAGSLLASRSEGEYQDAALRIAVRCLRTPGIESQYADAAGVLLDALANVPAAALAVERHYLAPDVESRLPIAPRLDWVRRHYTNRVVTLDGEEFAVNQFQRRLWEAVNGSDWVSFTAPTSAGKSFLLTRWIIDFLRREPNATVAYVVPTRALISEVEGTFTRLLQQAGDVRANVLSLPVRALIDPTSATILVVTQERLHMMMSGGYAEGAPTPLRLRLLVVDEAHKIGDRHRGVLLQQVIERAVAENPRLRVVFASPSASNPELFVQDAPSDASTLSVTSSEVTVNQNLLWVSAANGHNQRQWTVDLQWRDESARLGMIELAYAPETQLKRLAFVAHAMGERLGANVVYVNGAADAETVATLLYDLRDPQQGAQADQAHTDTAEDAGNDNDDEPVDPRLSDLIDLTRRTIHPRFALAATLRRGVAFHYGNLPLLIREEIERLFRDGAIHYLVCTSTLVEGVNTACRSIFIHGPRRGKNVKMSREDFWNLAGRAGRWGREFQGNIVCVDPTVERLWGPELAPRNRQLHRLERAADKLLAEPAELLEFINTGTPRTTANRRQDLEYTFAYLAGLHLRDGNLREAPWARHLAPAALATMETAVADSLAGLSIPERVVRRNPGVSPIAMNNLLRYFRERSKPIEELLPTDPTSDGAARNYTAIFGRIFSHLNGRLGPRSRHFALAILVTEWMRGRPLGVLISSRVRYEEGRKKKDPTHKVRLAVIIRNVMEDVEQVARFEAPRSLSAYLDVLHVFLEERDQLSLLADIPDLSLFLELGVNQVTQISLMALGLSRTSTLALSAIIANDRLDRNQARLWLQRNPWQDADLPELVKREVRRVLKLPDEDLRESA